MAHTPTATVTLGIDIGNNASGDDESGTEPGVLAEAMQLENGLHRHRYK